ncbi:hypothetical protein [Actinoplanes xinjiangensis]|uniref:hypothetical protein n=1 Tax=Actinoplanes xinjiangensis TaxID=512350 RepID=UPI003413B036
MCGQGSTVLWFIAEVPAGDTDRRAEIHGWLPSSFHTSAERAESIAHSVQRTLPSAVAGDTPDNLAAAYDRRVFAGPSRARGHNPGRESAALVLEMPALDVDRPSLKQALEPAGADRGRAAGSSGCVRPFAILETAVRRLRRHSRPAGHLRTVPDAEIEAAPVADRALHRRQHEG